VVLRTVHGPELHELLVLDLQRIEELMASRGEERVALVLRDERRARDPVGNGE
jgi:hypothetical protein